MTLITNFIALFVESAPYLLLGMFIAGVIHHWVPRTAVEKVLGQKGSVVNAAFIGAPLPLCSCSVIPVAMGVRRSGASKASTASFLVATPETGVDSIGITYALMGPVMTIIRPIAAISSAIITGFVIAIWGNEEASPQTLQPAKKCCHSHAQETPTLSWREKAIGVFTYGFDKLLADFMRWLLIGLFFAALIVTFVPANWMASYGSGPFAMLLMVLISIPMYICATASTPIAVGLLMAGISPGAALVFMLTGPATNIATLMVIKNELGKRELYLYLIALISSALAAGLLVDYLFTTFDWSLALDHGEHSDMQSFLYNASAVILAGLMLRQLVSSWWSGRSAVSA
ncbi:SO_0444 family Cu/Zn efflux transporter [Alteromonas sp. ASW11-36]|uniref:SO_0444 family Cu/Zn efflux transporter n=1 Tax=Alteromonas arenosi TaxID=3055817 RepID=A0ABT7T151_9ALTE|nr:SO_0444 family Cu/Zn efflux transporter [Alteromonas sp. ASW11-36]MDM7862181.1 SO_0444 family Cu/Zn efflux transporter [Alteromonas sp. ASW11-36]